MNPQKIYISGKITGLAQEVYEKFFSEAEEYLKKTYGCDVVNPTKYNPVVEGKTWEQYLLEDIKFLFDCDTVYMLRNWEDSRGARIEYAIAKELGKRIIFQDGGVMDVDYTNTKENTLHYFRRVDKVFYTDSNFEDTDVTQSFLHSILRFISKGNDQRVGESVTRDLKVGDKVHWEITVKRMAE